MLWRRGLILTSTFSEPDLSVLGVRLAMFFGDISECFNETEGEPDDHYRAPAHPEPKLPKTICELHIELQHQDIKNLIGVGEQENKRETKKTTHIVQRLEITEGYELIVIRAPYAQHTQQEVNSNFEAGRHRELQLNRC